MGTVQERPIRKEDVRVRVSVYSLPDDGVRSPIQNYSDYAYIQGNGTTPPGSREGMVYEYSYRLVLCCNVFDFRLSKSRSHVHPSICCLVKESNVYVESSTLHKSCEIKGAVKPKVFCALFMLRPCHFTN